MGHTGMNIQHPIYGIPAVHAAAGGVSVATPGPGRVSNQDQDLVLRIARSLSRTDANPRRIAADLFTQSPQVQRHLFEMLTHLLGLWAEMGEYTKPDHPLAREYAFAQKMVENLFT